MTTRRGTTECELRRKLWRKTEVGVIWAKAMPAAARETNDDAVAVGGLADGDVVQLLEGPTALMGERICK